MTPNEAKKEAIDKTKLTGQPHSVVRLKDNHFGSVPFNELNKRFSYYNTHKHLPTKKATFCIAVYKELQTLKDTVDDILRTVNRQDISIIVVDDGNNIDLKEFAHVPELTLKHNKERMGVGYSLDLGVSLAQTDIVFPMGCDIRFTEMGWMDGFIKTINDNPTSFISTAMVGLNKDRLKITGKEGRYCAAKILFEVTEKNNNKVLPFRRYLEAKWNTKINGSGVHRVGCALGAFYGCKKSWYEKIKGFSGHKEWGSLEPLISLRSYVAGGDCKVDLDTVTGHIFKAAGASKEVRKLIYNKLLIAYTLLPDTMEKIVFDWAATFGDGKMALNIVKENKASLDAMKQEMKGSIPPEELYKRILPTGILD